ncbi:unnamed protein product [Adineta ricciae]|uniref:Uncharacterized protein n=1 Tax=Adineta ricciae TaxID=249248 RepID=A0A816G772_ADIRI|nr:unnamed protein product [Adineta ricciae]CAF1670461.1 unnamed protein product [Adineta ricciae]
MLRSFIPQNTITIREYSGLGQRKQFYRKYPLELVGIIAPKEFYQSIDTINYVRGRTFTRKTLAVCLLFTILFVGSIITILGGVLTAFTSRPVWITLLSIGGTMFAIPTL